MRQQTETAAFQRWFGNSVVRNEDGTPKVVYHGTTAPMFTEFQPFQRRNEQLGFGIHFAESFNFAARYAFDKDTARKGKGEARVYSVFLSIQRPLVAPSLVVEGSPEFDLALRLGGRRLYVTKEDGRRIVYLQNAIDLTSGKRAESLIRDAGYDGVAYMARLLQPSAYGMVETGESPSWIVFDSRQIKSVDNVGSFDPQDPDILHGLRRR